MEIINITDYVYDDDMPSCPICKEPLDRLIDLVIGFYNDGVKEIFCLVHKDCLVVPQGD